MRKVRRTLSRSTFWGMIPLALWAGMPATGCFCADGSFKPFCGGQFAVGQNVAPEATSPDATPSTSDAQPHCPACASTDSAAQTIENAPATCASSVADSSCCGEGQSPGGGDSPSCCRLSEPANITLTSVLSLPDFTALGLPGVIDVVCAPRLTAAALARPYDVFETGPPVDRVIVLCSLLI